MRKSIKDRRLDRDQTGVITVFFALMTVALLLIVGCVVDFGRALADQRLAAVEAEEAARVGAGQVSVQMLRQGSVQLNDEAAIEDARSFTIAAGHPGSVSVRNGVVNVRIVESVPTTILNIVHVSEITVTASGSAIDVEGISKQD